ncbi:hypothetical protein ACFOWE_31450 [Planomonospora corallina]|uniref:Uncharacterized protein n=1 Tax=Planomonospora corallina TaxID=1806052 RepID=A0ABV8IIA2_9ACTN
MFSEKLSFADVSILVVLMVEAGEVSNPVLRDRYGLTLTGPQRLRLNELKLVESRRHGQSFVHELTDRGWARVAEEIRAGVGVPSRAGRAVAQALLLGVRRLMERTGQRPGDLFLPHGDPAADASGTSRTGVSRTGASDTSGTDTSGTGVSRTGASGTGVPVEDLEARIRAAYAALAPEPGAWVSLTRLRPLLGDAAKQEVDAALVRMNGLPDVNIVPESNGKILTPQDLAAAVVIGDQEKHLLWIGA